MTEACLRSVQSNLPLHVTVHGFTCPPTGPSAIEGRADAVLSAADCFRSLVPLLEERTHSFDGFLVACFSDHPLVAMLCEEYSQPTIGIMEAALYASRMCGHKLGVVTTSERSSELHSHSIADYGLVNFSVGCETGHVSVLELESKPKEEVYAKLTVAAKRLVVKGADCICLGCAGMTGMYEAVSEAVGMYRGEVMVVDGVTTGIQFLVALVQERLRTPKGGAYRSSAAGRYKRGQSWL